MFERWPEVWRALGDDEEQLTIDVAADGDMALVVLHGEADLAAAGRLELALDRATLGAVTSVVLDMADLGFVDCAALDVIARWQERHPQVTLRCRNVSPFVAKVLAIVGLDDRLSV